MEQKNRDRRFDEVCECLTKDKGELLLNIPVDIKRKAQELILRINKPLCIKCFDCSYYITKNGCLSSALLSQEMITVTKRDILVAFQNICNYSVYSRQNEIVNGFVTLNGGHRAGICGTAVLNDGKITNIKDISAIHIRISREFVGCSDTLFDRLSNVIDGLLICGSPSSGKTTMIRDIARKLSADFKVCIVDERGEIGAVVNGTPQNDIGFCDILDGYPKSQAIEQAIRCLSPDFIVCDEISNADDVKAIEEGVNSGVHFIATMHCNDEKSFMKRKVSLPVIKTDAFTKLVFLESRENAGKIKSVYDCRRFLND